jgi:ferredoxin-NADP reductase
MTLTERILGSKALAALTSPHGVDRYLELVSPMWAAAEVRARVVDVVRETEGVAAGAAPVATVTLQPTSTWRGHRAGQYIQVGVELPGARRTTRCFSISSAASAPGERFTITVRANTEAPDPERSVSSFLVHRVRPGQMLHLSQAEGDFTLPVSPATPGPDPLLMISGGSGITPVMSQLRTLLRDAPRYGDRAGRVGRRVVFLHFARSAEDQIFAEELAAIAAADNGVEVHLRYGDQRFSEFELRRLVPDFRDTDTWVCGPAGLVERVQEAYAVSAGSTTPGRLRVEYFKLATVVSTGPTTGAGSAEGDVTFTRAGTTTANTGASLLEQAEAAGLRPEFGCRMGICFSCTSRKSAGTVRNLLTGETSSLPDEDIRICVSAPEGDCVIDL